MVCTAECGGEVKLLMKVLDSEFAKDFIKLADDGWKHGFHERNGGNLSYRIKPEEVDEVKEDLANNGAAKVIHVQAKRSIEDWFLYDIEGILGFLRLGKNTKVSGKNGYDKLQRLYKQANKVYYKGIQSNGMIERLNIEKIANAVKEQLNPLYKALGVEKIK